MRIRIAVAAISLFGFCGATIAWTQLHGAKPYAATRELTDRDLHDKTGTGVVDLPDQKLAVLDIRAEPAERHSMQEVHVVPGRIQYDDAHRIDVRATANGILVQVRVMPGDRVSAGQVLAVVSSPEIGLARTEVHHSHESLELATKKEEWIKETSKNVAALVESLKNHTPMNKLEQQFRDKTLGKSRERLISAYSRYLLAESLAKSADTVGRKVLPVTTHAERTAERHRTEAVLQAACEQAGFDIQREISLAEIDTGDALRRLRIAEQHRTALLGYACDEVPEEATAGDALSRVEIRAPFDGTIEEKQFGQSDRVRPSEIIFVLADTRSVWVDADLREQDWPAMALEPGQELSVDTPAMPGCKLKARVKRAGRRVSPQTNSVSLIAEVENESGLLRPGLFVRVSIPIGNPRDVLSIPISAVLQHEGTKFVFVQIGLRTFRRADVTTGLETDKSVEIVSGLRGGEPVVVAGAVAIKAEMLIATQAKEH
jgi:membrane fusion protein, heavy metal efflux system